MLSRREFKVLDQVIHGQPPTLRDTAGLKNLGLIEETERGWRLTAEGQKQYTRERERHGIPLN